MTDWLTDWMILRMTDIVIGSMSLLIWLIFYVFLLITANEDRRGRGGRREDPRRHTLGSDRGDMLHYGGQGQPTRTMDLEVNNQSWK